MHSHQRLQTKHQQRHSLLEVDCLSHRREGEVEGREAASSEGVAQQAEEVNNSSNKSSNNSNNKIRWKKASSKAEQVI